VLLLMATSLIMLGVGGLGIAAVLNSGSAADLVSAPPVTPTATAAASPSPSPTPSPTPTAPPSYAMNGPKTYEFASGTGPVVGTGGPLRKYRVAVEHGVPVSVEEFTRFVDETLSDPRSWIGGGNVRLQRIDGDASGSSFTIYLVTPGTAYDLCLAAGFDIFWRGEPYSSCYTGRVLINLSRYLKGIPDYGAPLDVYRQYLVNHEVGHALGHGHELCPADGELAPVMQQQTFDMQGCVANAWPYVNGKRYSGPPGRIVPRD